MSSAVEFYDVDMECPECGHKQKIMVLQEQSTKDSESFRDIPVGQFCDECNTEFTSDDTYIDEE